MRRGLAIRFCGGPWDERSSQATSIDKHPPKYAPGGVYRYDYTDEYGVFVYRYVPEPLPQPTARR
jgi:hypothetical protein